MNPPNSLNFSGGPGRGRAAVRDRSLMDVSFNLADLEMKKRFLDEAVSAGFSGLAGHRSIGGVRASLYDAVTLAAVEKLVGIMEGFQNRHASRRPRPIPPEPSRRPGREEVRRG